MKSIYICISQRISFDLIFLSYFFLLKKESSSFIIINRIQFQLIVISQILCSLYSCTTIVRSTLIRFIACLNIRPLFFAPLLFSLLLDLSTRSFQENLARGLAGFEVALVGRA